MRYGMIMGLAGLALAAGVSAGHAQGYPTTTTGSGYAPLYVTPGSGSSSGYSPYAGYGRSGGASAYGAPLQQQAVPGVNAPSYNYKSQTGGAPMNAQDALAQRALRDQQAQIYQDEFYQQAQGMAAGTPMAGAVNGMMAPQAPPVKKTRRLVKREEDNPLSVPPRLFSID